MSEMWEWVRLLSGSLLGMTPQVFVLLALRRGPRHNRELLTRKLLFPLIGPDEIIVHRPQFMLGPPYLLMAALGSWLLVGGLLLVRYGLNGLLAGLWGTFLFKLVFSSLMFFVGTVLLLVGWNLFFADIVVTDTHLYWYEAHTLCRPHRIALADIEDCKVYGRTTRSWLGYVIVSISGKRRLQLCPQADPKMLCEFLRRGMIPRPSDKRWWSWLTADLSYWWVRGK